LRSSKAVAIGVVAIRCRVIMGGSINRNGGQLCCAGCTWLGGVAWIGSPSISSPSGHSPSKPKYDLCLMGVVRAEGQARVHGGGFYRSMKYLGRPRARMPAERRFQKGRAHTKWLFRLSPDWWWSITLRGRCRMGRPSRSSDPHAIQGRGLFSFFSLADGRGLLVLEAAAAPGSGPGGGAALPSAATCTGSHSLMLSPFW